MSAAGSAAAATETTETPTEGAETEGTTEAEATETPPEGEGGAPAPETETTEGEAPAEGEQPEEKPTPEEGELAALAEKYAKDLWSTANRTMAAARRAEARVVAVKNENTTLKSHLQVYSTFVDRLQKGDPSALGEIGFKSVREFLDAVANHGEQKPETAESRLERLEREQKERDSKETAAKHEAFVAEQKKLVFGAVDADKARFRYVSTSRGHGELWEALGEYVKLHGDISDDGVFAVADAVEASLREEFGAPPPPRVPAARPAAKNGAPAPAEKKNSGKTLNNATGSGAPATRDYPMDLAERKRVVNAELRAEGLL
jgi:hypothetical protein